MSYPKCGYLFTHRPGRVVKGLIVAVQDFGVLIKLSDSIKALCPLTHLSDITKSKISSKFAVSHPILHRLLHTAVVSVHAGSVVLSVPQSMGPWAIRKPPDKRLNIFIGMPFSVAFRHKALATSTQQRFQRRTLIPLHEWPKVLLC